MNEKNKQDFVTHEDKDDSFVLPIKGSIYSLIFCTGGTLTIILFTYKSEYFEFILPNLFYISIFLFIIPLSLFKKKDKVNVNYSENQKSQKEKVGPCKYLNEEITPNKLVIKYSNYFEIVSILQSCLGATAFLVFFIYTLEENNGYIAVSIICFLGFLFFGTIFYQYFSNFLNSTVVTINERNIKISNTTLPSFKRKKLYISRSIVQLYINKIDNEDAEYFEIKVIDHHETTSTFLSNIKSYHEALRIEQLIEDFLQIQEIPVEDEFLLRE